MNYLHMSFCQHIYKRIIKLVLGVLVFATCEDQISDVFTNVLLKLIFEKGLT